jgi:PAP2 superfamily
MNFPINLFDTSTPPSRYLSLAMIIGLLCVDLVWSPFSTLRFGADSLTALIIVLVLSLFAFLLYKQFKFPIVIMSLGTELFILLLFSGVGFVFSYLVTASGGPLQDELIITMDKAVGFDWREYVAIFVRNDFLRTVSLIFYLLTPLLVIFSLIWFCLQGEISQASALVAMIILGGILCIGISGIFPNAGAAGYFLPDKNFYQGSSIIVDSHYMQTFFDLRKGAGIHVSFLQPVALISFPSYHSCMALLVVLCFRGRKAIYWVMLALNGVTLFIIPVEGGHHLSDVLAGAFVAMLAYWLVMGYERYIVARFIDYSTGLSRTQPVSTVSSPFS